MAFHISMEAQDKLHDLAKRTTKTQALIRLIADMKDEPLTPPEPARSSGYTLPDHTHALLKEIKERNNLKSINQTVELLIKSAWDKRFSNNAVHSTTPVKSDNI